VFLASIVCAIELAVSGTSPIQVALPAMAGVHALIGIGEGLITGAVLSLVLATRADLLQLQKV
jgi:cobalt/nickel transport system permease protein